MFMLTAGWDTARQRQLEDADSLIAAANAASDALRNGDAWPDVAWMEDILTIGANASAAAVLNHGRYEDLKDVCNLLCQEVLDRRWLWGGPNGVLEQHEVEGLSRAVGQWQVRSAAPAADPPAEAGSSSRGGLGAHPKGAWSEGQL